MTDRIAGWIVTLEKDMREDDAEAITTAIRMLRGVVSVTPLKGDLTVALAEERVRAELRGKIWEALK